jgi:gluconolactonase
VIADRYDGKRLNSPNDVVVAADGSIWFTDPSYGIDSDYEGHRAESEIGACHVYRVDPADGSCRIVADDFERPNGLAFAAGERQLFVADTRVNHIRVFDVGGDGTLVGKILVPEAAVSNVVFGGPKRNRLFISASTSVYSIHLHVNGLNRGS